MQAEAENTKFALEQRVADLQQQNAELLSSRCAISNIVNEPALSILGDA